jgi:hypothetical protein
VVVRVTRTAPFGPISPAQASAGDAVRSEVSMSIARTVSDRRISASVGHGGPMHPLTLAGASRFPHRLFVLATLLVLAVAACTGSGAPTDATPAGPRVEFTTDRGIVTVRVEVVDTPEARQRGLMGRTALDDDAGMLFVWPEDASSSFHMKDTLIPLSIAFIAADGTVLRILDMEPCAADPCPVYDPKTSYRTALEVDKGAFTRWGIREGDRAAVVREGP